MRRRASAEVRGSQNLSAVGEPSARESAISGGGTPRGRLAHPAQHQWPEGGREHAGQVVGVACTTSAPPITG